MRRLPVTPRDSHESIVASQGLVYHSTPVDGGGAVPYWFENAYYEMPMDEVLYLERVTEDLHAKAVEAAKFLASGAFGDLGLPAGTLELARESLTADPVSVYGRFDLVYDATGPAKMLEYNADTPTGLLEASVAQWFWARDVMPGADQWNSLHERLIAAWHRQRHRLPGLVHFAHMAGDTTGEEPMTVTYLRDTAEQAGLRTAGIAMDRIGWNATAGRFVDLQDRPIDACFKLYPWEQMLTEPFGRHLTDPSSSASRHGGVLHAGTAWIEPLWKVLLSNKALAAAMWHLYEGHENLLPSYLDDPGPLTSWVRKPLHGREGAGITIHTPELYLTTGDNGWGEEGYAYQQYTPLPDLGGGHLVIGSWVVDGAAAGAGFRESDSPVTDFHARFVPHVITAAAPSPEQTLQALAAEGVHLPDTYQPVPAKEPHP
jgi:glutathionylspermidine synthase